MLSDFDGKSVLIYGMGRSGCAAADFLSQQGARLTLCDDNAVALEELKKYADGTTVHTGLGLAELEKTITFQDLVVVSPGIQSDHPVQRIAAENNIPVVGEIELGAYSFKGNLIAVTGTNGKSTTVTAIGKLLEISEGRSMVLGNIGIPFLEKISEANEHRSVVLEISAAQLEIAETIKPKISVLLNITQDHLERHGPFEKYIQIKSSILKNQRRNDVAILNHDCPIVRHAAKQCQARTIWFSLETQLDDGVWYDHAAKVIRVRVPDRYSDIGFELSADRKSFSENFLPTVAVGIALGLSDATILRGLKEFCMLEHRLEYVADIDGVAYFNDSKATNPGSTVFALKHIDGRPTLICGGKDDKCLSYEALGEAISDRVGHLVLIGQTATKISEAINLNKLDSVTFSKTLQEAVKTAKAETQQGEAVIFSPGANSKDMFKSHLQRGRYFKELVDRLKNERNI